MTRTGRHLFLTMYFISTRNKSFNLLSSITSSCKKIFKLKSNELSSNKTPQNDFYINKNGIRYSINFHLNQTPNINYFLNEGQEKSPSKPIKTLV